MGADPGLNFRELVSNCNILIIPRFLVAAMRKTATILRQQIVNSFNILATPKDYLVAS